MRSRQRVAFLGAVWRPMLAGAAGAAIIIACAWVAMPKFTIREVTADHVTLRDVTINNPSHAMSRSITTSHARRPSTTMFRVTCRRRGRQSPTLP